MGKKQFCFFQTAETGNRTPNSGVKGSGANHYPRAPAQLLICESPTRSGTCGYLGDAMWLKARCHKQQTLSQCLGWTILYEGGPTSTQHCVNVSVVSHQPYCVFICGPLPLPQQTRDIEPMLAQH